MPLFAPSTAGEAWLSRLKISWLSTSQVWRGFASILVDRLTDWARTSLTEHLPQYASADAVPLIGSERLLERGPTETLEQYATRLTNAVQQWGFARTPVGLLLALYYAGFNDVVLVQQNGLAFQLASTDLNADPRSLVLKTDCSALICPLHSTVHLNVSIPTGTPWWTFDDDVEHTSRFALLISVRKIARVTFDGTEDGSTLHPWPMVIWPSSFPSSSYNVFTGIPVVTDGGGGVVIVGPVLGTQTTTGVQISSSAPFAGYVDIFAYGPGSNPLADPSAVAAQVPLITAVVDKWRPAKALKMGAHVIVSGKYFGWPKRTFGSGGTFGPGVVDHYDI